VVKTARKVFSFIHGWSVAHEDLDEISRESGQDKEKEERGKYDDYDKY